MKGRKVEDAVIEGIDTKDYPDFVDAYIGSANFADGEMEDLTEDELNQLTEENPEYIQEEAVQQSI